jgi:hypothetical protein
MTDGGTDGRARCRAGARTLLCFLIGIVRRATGGEDDGEKKNGCVCES